MANTKFKNYRIFYNFLNSLAKDLTKFYYRKLNKPFKVSNKLKGKGYDPVTTSDMAFEKFIRNESLIVNQMHSIYFNPFVHHLKQSNYL